MQWFECDTFIWNKKDCNLSKTYEILKYWNIESAMSSKKENKDCAQRKKEKESFDWSGIV